MRRKLLKSLGCSALAVAATLAIGLPMADEASAAADDRTPRVASAAADDGSLRIVTCDFDRDDQMVFTPFISWKTCYEGVGEVALSLWSKPLFFSSGSHAGWLAYQDKSGADKKLYFKPHESHTVSDFQLRTLHVDS